ncbi:hypothetical protein BDA96_02G220800 [Sorghum bicolor]|uniref:Uncharacterized protein n=2 Tax=Sorghum bicolor TaxID=4558 RepID=A0A1W0W5D0_SORBI|nr:hypothetical protein BDA96_02G220800 [Sorghum bicolor]OQU89546.1 hypothetical protein SORBI_3002G210150 [Sorghum bicolor]
MCWAWASSYAPLAARSPLPSWPGGTAVHGCLHCTSQSAISEMDVRNRVGVVPFDRDANTHQQLDRRPLDWTRLGHIKN